MLVVTQALHVPELCTDPVPIETGSPQAGALVCAVKDDLLPPVVVVMDVRAAGRNFAGLSAVEGMPEVLSWCYENLPSEWLEQEDALWLCIGPNSEVCVMSVGVGYAPSYTVMKWPGQRAGSIQALFRAFPRYASQIMVDYEGMAECV